jgi:hypothetical protein
MPGLKCEASDAARAGKYLWGFGDYFREAEWDLLFALGQYASAYNLELLNKDLIDDLRCVPAPSSIARLKELRERFGKK